MTLLYLLALAGHGMEHRFAFEHQTTDVAPKDACDTCAFLQFAGHSLGRTGNAPAVVLTIDCDGEAAASSTALVFIARASVLPLGSRAPPRAA